MESWEERPNEVKNLLNPAFCGRLLFEAVKGYEENVKDAMPFPLVYLVLPLVLHKRTREKINCRTAFINWVQSNPNVLIGFKRRTGDLVDITNLAVEFMLQTEYFQITEDGKLEIGNKKLSTTKSNNMDVKECLRKAKHVGKWFASNGRVDNIFIALGVKP